MIEKTEIKRKFLAYLEDFITENKKEVFAKVLQHRTKHITVALEDIYQSQNASAVLRSCDCFGIQDVHIIENRYEYSVNPDVALGSTKWLNLIKYNLKENNTLECFQSLRDKGYRIVATSPHRDDILLDELDLTEKTALVFGTELEGLTDTAIEHADAFVKIPMHGFTESLNISVSAAVTLHHLTEKLRASNIAWQLSEKEMLETRILWAKSVVKHPEKHEATFMKMLGTD
jgi:tRNA (guanosine-2'-O-)-methyltransferase